MFYSAAFLATAAFASLVAAQNTTGTTLTIDTGSVPYVTRQSWCLAQTNNCPLICGGSASPNSCDPTTLEYVCTCTSGNQPNISAYDQTVPSFICQEYIKECVNSHPNDLQGITDCRALQCGTKNVSSADSSSSSSSMTASMTSTASGAGGSASSAAGSASSRASSAGSSATSAAASATSSASAAIVNVATNYGTGILATALLAVFGLAL